MKNTKKAKLMTLGGRITLARESANLTDQQLSRSLGVLLKSLRNWETDRSEPRGNKLLMLSGVLGVSLGWLITGEDENVENLDETKFMQVKINHLLNLHEQTSALIFELEADLTRLQSRIDQSQINGTNVTN